MSVVSTAAEASHFDWGVIATGLATFVVALWATWQGLQKGKSKIESGTGMTAIVGGTLMDNMTMRDLADALRQNTDAIRDHTRELQRHNDLVVMIGHVKRDD